MNHTTHLLILMTDYTNTIVPNNTTSANTDHVFNELNALVLFYICCIVELVILMCNKISIRVASTYLITTLLILAHCIIEPQIYDEFELHLIIAFTFAIFMGLVFTRPSVIHFAWLVSVALNFRFLQVNVILLCILMSVLCILPEKEEPTPITEETKETEETEEIEETKETEIRESEYQICIAFMGKKYSGKTTASQYFETEHNFHSVAFASPLKKACKAIFGLSDEQLYGARADKETKIEEFDKSPRQIFQELGELIKTNFGKDIWISALSKKIDNLGDNNIIISDCRYKNEAAAIKNKFGGYIVKIIREEDKEDTHVSETELDEIKYDFIVYNKGTIENFHQALDKLYEIIQTKAKYDYELEQLQTKNSTHALLTQ